MSQPSAAPIPISEMRCDTLVRRFVTGFFFSALCVALPVSARADTLAEVRARGVLVWGGDMQGGPPYVFEDETGRLVGFEVEIANALAAKLGVRAEFKHAEWASLVAELDRGSFDIAMNGLEVMPSREGQVLMTRPYYIFAERLMRRKGDVRVRDLSSLRGLRVGTLTNSLAWLVLESAGAEAIPYDGTDTPYIDLAEGRLDAVLLDDIIAKNFGETNPRLEVAGDVATGSYAIACRKSDRALRDAIDHALEAILRDGTLRNILGKWELDGPRQSALSREGLEPIRAHAENTDSSARSLSGDGGTRAAPHFTSRHFVLFLNAAFITLVLSVVAMLLASSLGLLLAIGRLWGPRPLAAVITSYVELIRGTPVLLQLYLIYFGLSPWISFHPYVAAALGLGLNYAAYEAEVYRGGFNAVPHGQMEASLVLGMSHRTALRRIIVPQALRISLPAMTNDFISLLKDSSLVSVIAVVELTKRMTIVAVELRSWLVPAILCAVFYFLMSYPLSILSRKMEARLARA